MEVEAKDQICKLHCCMGIFGIFFKYNISVSKDEIEILHKVGRNGDGANMAFTMMQKFWNSTSQVKEKMLISLI
jgi:hypothetical protein